MEKKKYIITVGNGETGVSVEMNLTEQNYEFVKELFMKFEKKMGVASEMDELVNLEFEVTEVGTDNTLTVKQNRESFAERYKREAEEGLKIIKHRQDDFFESLIEDFVPEEQQADVRTDVSTISFIDDVEDLKTENG